LSAPVATHTAAYRQQSVMTATPGQLVVMLYDGCLRFLHQGAYAMRDGSRLQAHSRLARAEAIIDELLATLDMEQGGEIAARLQGIYVFCRSHLLEARREQDAEKIDAVARLLGELREAFAQVAGTA
jgi:flagellar secretion chaperone FliS